MSETAEEVLNEKTRRYSYPSMTKTLGSFKLTVEGGSFTDSEIIVMLGENGMGKTTLIKLLAGSPPDDEESKLSLSVSMKPQKIAPQFPGSVRSLLLKRIKPMFMNAQFETDVLKPMNLDAILDQEVKTLSGGELQRVAIVLALGLQVSLSFSKLQTSKSLNILINVNQGRCLLIGRTILLPGLRTKNHRVQGDQTIHSPRETNRVCYRTRFYYGDISSGSCNRFPRHASNSRHSDTVSVPCYSRCCYPESCFNRVIVQTAIPPYWHEQVLGVFGDHVQERPD